jgi:hypothetical protein
VKRPRFTIGGLLVFIVAAALSLAALRESTDLWAAAVSSTSLLVLAIAVLLAVHCSKRKRAFWLGFSIFGWTYLVLTLVPITEQRLLTTQALMYLDSKIPRADNGRINLYYRRVVKAFDRRMAMAQPVALKGLTVATASPGQTVQGQTAGRLNLKMGRLWTLSNGTTDNFVRIGHGIWVWIIGFVGGCVSIFLARDAVSQRDGDRRAEEPLSPGHHTAPAG